MRPTVGDMVKILAGGYSGHPTGTIGVITEDDHDSQPFLVDANGETYWYQEHEVELIPDARHLAPVLPYGVSPDALAEYVETFIKAAQSRIRGTGAKQYNSPEGQLFERLTPAELITMAREEAQDLAVYAAMLDIRLARIADALDRKGLADAA